MLSIRRLRLFVGCDSVRLTASLGAALFCTSFSLLVSGAEQPRFLLQWGQQGTENGEFDFPIGIAINRADEVFVTDFTNYRVQKFTQEGKFLAAFEVSLFPGGIALDREGNVYVAHGGIPPSRYERPR